MLLTGLVMPYMTPWSDDVRVTVAPDGTLAPVRSAPRTLVFDRGAFTRAIASGEYCELVVNGMWREHLSSTRHGLAFYETPAGLYFNARLPETPYATAIHAAIVAGKIRHVCPLATMLQCDQQDDQVFVRDANVVGVNLLLAAKAHIPATWIMPAGPEAEQRVSQEARQADSKTFWALDGQLTKAQMIAGLDVTDPDARTIVDQLQAG